MQQVLNIFKNWYWELKKVSISILPMNKNLNYQGYA